MTNKPSPVPFIDLKAQYQALKPEIDANIQKVLDHGQFVMGPEVDELEKKLAQYLGCKQALACSSGTDAAIIAMMALGIGPGDEVIMPGFSFIATAETVVLVGAKPVLVDIDPHTYNIDIHQIEAGLSEKTRAIVPVGLYGQAADMDEINALAKKYNLHVIEDAAQSFGAPYKSGKSGALSLVGCTSFFPAKPLGCYGDGGAIFTNDDSLAEAMKEIRVHGQKSRYYHTRIGVNGRFDTLQAAIMLPKLERFGWEVEQREKWARRYSEKLAPLSSEGLVLPFVKEDRASVWAQYSLRVPGRETFQKTLAEHSVPTSVHYPSTMADQPAYRERVRALPLPESERAAREVVSLPIYPDMTEEIQDRVVAAIFKHFGA